MTILEAKKTARAFLREQYSDTNLTKALDHMRAGNFSFTSCCCFIGLVTADHALRNYTMIWQVNHYYAAKCRPGADAAEAAVAVLGRKSQSAAIYDDLLRRRLIPMILFEIKRRGLHVRMEAHRVVELEASPLLQKV